MKKHPQLLPSGLYDLLPPDAKTESHAIQRLMEVFDAFGYAQVSPPLVEFEAGLLTGRGEALASETFRIMDPLSQNMMGVRADITLQVARIAASRMGGAPRPLRLCYSGPILRVKAESLRSERQLTQAGIELIGADSLEADIEVMGIAAEALEKLGVTSVSIDINLPGLLGELCPEAAKNTKLRQQIKDAVQRRDASMIAGLPLVKSALLASLLEAAGPVEKCVAMLKQHQVSQADMLMYVADSLRERCPRLSLTIDPLEYRGFDYHQGIGFSIFTPGLRHELGRGGRYRTIADESATGFTLYVTHLLKLLTTQPDRKRILVPAGAPVNLVSQLREEGWATIGGLDTKDPGGEAKRMGCSHWFDKGKVVLL